MKLQRVIFRIKKCKANLNINTQITIHVRSLPWHSGESVGVNWKQIRGRELETNEVLM